MIKPMHRLTSTTTIILSLAIIVLFILSYWNSFSMPFERDEGEYAYAAWLMDQGGLPYIDTFLQKPPLVVYVYWLAHKIGPFSLWAPRFLLMLFNVCTLLFMFLFVKRQAGVIPGLATVLMAIPLLSSALLTGMAANTEQFMLMPLTGLLTLSFYRVDSNKVWHWVLGGTCAACAVLFKPIAALPAFAILFYWLARNFKSHRSVTYLAKNTLVLLSGGTSAVLLALLPILLNGGINDFWFQTVVFNASYMGAFGENFPSSFYYYLSLFWKNWWPMVVITFASVILRPRHWMFLWILVLLSLLTVMRSLFGHYYLLILPFFILIVSMTLPRLWELMEIKVANKIVSKTLMAATLMIIIAVCIAYPLRNQYWLSGRELSSYVYGNDHPFIESSIIAEKVKSYTNDNDRIFVAGSEPQIYIYSRRRSASKFDITYPFVLKTPYRDKCQKEAIQELEQNNPAAIVVSQSPTSGLWDIDVPSTFVDFLRNLTMQRYQLIGGTFKKKGEVRWHSPITSMKEMNAATLLLFVRKERIE